MSMVLIALALFALGAPAEARAGAAPDVTFIASANVAAAFAKGVPLVETGGYKVHASRRTAPGQAEIHVRDTDIIYVLEGEATLVTGGEVVEGTTTAPGEIRGPAIRNGQASKLVKGDVLIVPNGTPHWFQDVRGTFLYYVVKVAS